MSNGKRFTLPVCTGCGGIFGYRLDGGCTCEPSHAKTGKNLSFMEVSEHNADLKALAQKLEERSEAVQATFDAEKTHGTTERFMRRVEFETFRTAAQLVRAKISEGSATSTEGEGRC